MKGPMTNKESVNGVWELIQESVFPNTYSHNYTQSLL